MNQIAHGVKYVMKSGLRADVIKVQHILLK